ncbi:MAG: glycosyltransferase family 4 protein [Deltaproteobacteria bacterium]|nr:glycosyltransferase family 4 protein [Deltaproteobacteria bacterium]
MLYLALNPGNTFGWGVCSKYLISEVGKLREIRVVNDSNIGLLTEPNLQGRVFHAIGDHSLRRQYPIKGEINYGYTFFENLLEEDALKNARFYDLVFAGSTWCRQKLEEKGISWVQTLIQGIDPDLFFPLELEKPSGKDKFIIFSGGKFELRKGQDLVLRAVKVLQDKYDDIVLMNLWQNHWKFSFETMKRSSYINFVVNGETWEEIIKNIMAENGIDPERNIVLPPINNNQLKNVYANTDIGLFPNRCEGGTNLVLMEYMACARPVIASYNTGHRDILTKDNALLLEEMKPYDDFDEKGEMLGAWQEPDLDELVSKLEYAYLNRDGLDSIARQAGEDMKRYTWHATAKDLLEKIEQR